jgi:hypothetical protein
MVLIIDECAKLGWVVQTNPKLGVYCCVSPCFSKYSASYELIKSFIAGSAMGRYVYIYILIKLYYIWLNYVTIAH